MKILDKITEKITGKECVRVTHEQMVELVRNKFIKGADADYLKKVQKTANCSGLLTQRSLKSPSGAQTLGVAKSYYPLINLLTGKNVWVHDDEDNKIYDIKGSQWKKFYKGVEAAIEAEKRAW